MAEPDFQQALAHHQNGRLDEAAALYQAILHADPVHFDALHLLGVIEAQRGQAQSAVDLITRAIAVDAGHAVVHFNLGLALQSLGRPADALASHQRAVALQPEFAEAFNSSAEALLSMGRHADALAAAERAVALDPRHAEALFLRGVALQGLQRQAEALASYDSALQLQPALSGALNNRGLALQAMGRFEEALESYERFLALEPGRPHVLLSRAHLLRDLARHAQAIDAYAQVLAAQPGQADALQQRGKLLMAVNRPAEAAADFDALLAGDPAQPDLWFQRGVALLGLQRAADALASFDHALAGDPNRADALVNRGVALQALQRDQEALASYDRAVALRPDFAQALSNRALLLHGLGRHAEALAGYDLALAADPLLADTFCSRGVVLQALGRHAEALQSYERALALKPDFTTALVYRANTLLTLFRHAEAAQAYSELLKLEPDHDYAIGNRLHAELFDCDWHRYATGVKALSDAVRAGRRACMPFAHLSMSFSAAEQLQCARAYVAASPAPVPLWRGENYRHDKIRLAYVSADLREHAMSHLLAELFETHDKRRFELIAIALRSAEDSPTGRRVKAAFTQFIDASASSDAEVARLMRSLEVDIAVDLMGYTMGARPGIFAHRPAPLQVNYLGYPGTSGADYMDYIIADPHIIPAASRVHYAEQVVHLPDTYQPRDSTASLAAAPPTRAQAGLPEPGFVFCCFNNAYKINPPVFDTWMRLLRGVPGSVLWLLETHRDATANLRREARARGVEPARLVFAGRTDLAGHLSRHRLADLFLDTLPYTAHTTASDALWAGLPLLTCMGDTFASRVAGSLLGAAGLPDLVTHDLAEYEALALRLATTPALLNQARERLSKQRSQCALFDTPRYRKHLESAYLTMVERHQQGLPPQGFAVAQPG